MDLRQLRYFVAVAEDLHFGRAAKRLNLSQPPLSQQVQRLETSLGTALLDRTSRRVRLTAAGSVLLERARALLEAADATRDAVGRASRGEEGRLRIGFVHFAGYGFLPEIVSAYRTRYPDVVLSLRAMMPMQQFEALHEYRLDLGIVRAPVPEQDLVQEVFVSEAFVVALPEDHPLAGRPRCRLSDFAADRFVLYPADISESAHEKMETLFRKAGFKPKPAVEVSTVHTALGFVSAGIGLAIVPASASRMRLQGLAFAEIEMDGPREDFAFLYRPGPLPPVVERFTAIGRDLMADSTAPGRRRPSA